jgi:predicted ferric reductase
MLYQGRSQGSLNVDDDLGQTEREKVLTHRDTIDAMSLVQGKQGTQNQMSDLVLAQFVNGCEDRVEELLRKDYKAEEAAELVAKCGAAYKMKFDNESIAEVASAVLALSNGLKAFDEKHAATVGKFQKVVKKAQAVGLALAEITDQEITSMESVESHLAPAAEDDDRHHWEGDDHHARAAFRFEQKGQLEKFRESETAANAMAFSAMFIPMQIIGIAYGYYIYATSPKGIAYASLWLTVARCYGLMLCLTTLLIIFLMCRGILTKIRLSLHEESVLTSILDKHVLMHRMLGASLVPQSILHTGAHYLGLLRAMMVNPDENPLPRPPGSESVHLSWPVVSGYILWIILILFCGLSIKRVRRPMFEMFHYPHLILTWLWVTFLVNHGAIQWSGFGVPACFIVNLPIFLWYGIERGFQIRASTNPSIRIESALVYGKTMVIHVNLRGSDYTYLTGMYSMIRVPQISPYQWHPFTIASGSEHQLRLVIGVAGDWTGQLAKLIQNAQNSHPVRYPAIDVRGGFGAPASGMKFAGHAIMVGGGVGATPFLSFLSSICNQELLGQTASRRVDYSNIVKARFYWVTREPADFIWVNHYQEIISSHPNLQNRVSLQLLLTKTLETTKNANLSAAELALFWHSVSFALKCGGKAISKTIGVPTQFGRPNWEKEFIDFAATVDLKTAPMEKRTSMLAVPQSRFANAVEVGVYICGNVHLQKGCEQAAIKCNNQDIEFKLFIEEF